VDSVRISATFRLLDYGIGPDHVATFTIGSIVIRPRLDQFRNRLGMALRAQVHKLGPLRGTNSVYVTVCLPATHWPEQIQDEWEADIRPEIRKDRELEQSRDSTRSCPTLGMQSKTAAEKTWFILTLLFVS